MAAAFVLFACQNKKEGYKITLNFEDSTAFEGCKLVLSDRDTTINDTVSVLNNKAEFVGVTDDVKRVIIKAIDKKFSTSLFLENAQYTITVFSENNSIILGGGELQKVTDSLSNAVNEFAKTFANVEDMDQLYELYDKAETQEQKDSIRNIFRSISEKREEIYNNYLNENPKSLYALYNAASQAPFIATDSLQKLYDNFASVPEFSNKNFLNRIKENLDKKLALAPGQQAPDFTLNDPDGNPIKLSDFYVKNKITMIDFWASWCGPCRAFNPTLTKLYAKYKNKGFGILGVSLDRDHDSWIKGIKDDKLEWTHVSDLKYWDSEAGRMYNISSIPQSYFVDQTGKIVLQSPSHEEIEKFLEENFK